MRLLFAPFQARFILLTFSIVIAAVSAALMLIEPAWWRIGTVPLVIGSLLTLIGLRDLIQTRHAVLRNYPIAAHLRFLFESIRPEIRQYFFEGDTDGVPFSRDQRAIVYQRAKGQLDKRPFGTQLEAYDPPFEWMTHSMAPRPVCTDCFRITIGGPACAQPYSASVFNISAMSYGALSANAVRSLNKGAKIGHFAHDTGEGGFSPYHKENGGDIIWEIGSGYFGARNKDGTFSPETFAATAVDPQIKMIELKLSQGAKPGHGGVLPGPKVTAEIAKIRSVETGVDCVSPAAHSAFSTPIEMMRFLAELRRLSGGKPVGFKLCVGHPHEFLALVKAMLETGIRPDFIVVDGTEGGTGAAPLEFLDHVGMPLRDGLTFVHSALIGANLRHEIKIGAAGKIITGFDIARAMALGADWCNAARGFMFAVGCIQAQACHTGHCPTGVTSQDPSRQRAVVVSDKSVRVANFHRHTIEALAEIVAAAGLNHPNEITGDIIRRRAASDRVITLAELYPTLRPGELLAGTHDPRFKEAWARARADSFTPQPALFVQAAE